MTARAGRRAALSVLLLAWSQAPAGSQEGAAALFNGKDLSGFYSFLGRKPGEKEPIGKNADTLGVFTVRDGMIRVSGEVNGFLSTEQEFENFHLTVEFKWGEATHPPRQDRARAGGILYHVGGPDKTWPSPSLECQFLEGGTGSILLQGSKFDFEEGLRPLLSPMIKLSRDETKVLAGKIYRIGHDPGWQDVKGFRSKDEVEKPHGEWNVVEVVSEGGAFRHAVNGKVVAKGTGAEPRRGRIALISEGAELFIRKVEIRPAK